MPAASFPRFLTSALRTQVESLNRSEQVVVEALHLAKQSAVAHFRTVQSDLAAFEADSFSQLISALVRSVYPRKHERWNKGHAYHRYLAITRMMTRTLAVMAHRPPETYLIGGDGERLPEDHAETQLWRRDERDVRVGSMLKAIDRGTVLHKSLMVESAWVKGRMRWLRWRPHRVLTVQDPRAPSDVDTAPAIFTEMPLAVDDSGVKKLMYGAWVLADGEYRYWYVDENGVSYDPGLEALRGGTNPYGRHPFAVWRDDEPDDGELFLPAREDWWTEQRAVCRHLMGQSHTLDFQAFAIPVLRNWTDAEDQTPTISPDEPVRTLHPEADLEFRHPEPNLEAVEQVIDNALRRFAVVEGLPADFWARDKGARSLAGLKMDRQHLTERREERTPDYDHFLDETFRAHKAVANFHRPGRTYSDEVRLVAVWQSPPMPVDVFQAMQALSEGIRLGVDSAVDEVMRRRPQLTREEAAELVDANLERAQRTRPAAPVAARTGGGVPRPPDVRRDREADNDSDA